MKIFKDIIVLGVFTLFFSICPFEVRADFISIDPGTTYLRTNNDGAGDAVAIDLFNLSATIHPNDEIRLERVGDYSPFSSFGDINMSMIGVFSSTSVLGPSTDLNRVSGAIDAGVDFQTAPTNHGNLETDIAEDFIIGSPDGLFSWIQIQIPENARYLFLSTHDSLFGDNGDPNNNYGIRITGVNIDSPVPEPSTMILFASGLAGLAGIGRRRQH